MKTLRLAGVLWLVLLAASCTRDRDIRLTVVVTTQEPVSRADTVFLAGNAEALGAWRPNGLPLERIDSLTWRKGLDVARGTQIEFKVTRGSWGAEALTDDGTIPANRSLVGHRDTTIRVTVPGWKDLSGLAFGQVTGEVEYLRGLQGNGIPPRDVIVWLPPGYRSDVAARYPVLYVHDGQNAFDPKTSYLGVDWQIDENADSLSRAGQMKEIIVVAVNNTTARSDEYDVGDMGRLYLEFLVDSLKPRIDARFRTLPDREHTGIMGSSMGGTISFQALWLRPDVFSKAACLSPYFPNTLPARVRNSGWDISGLSLYIDDGDDELDTRLQSGIDRMLPVLRELGFEDGHTLVWKKFAGARHNEEAWARRVWRPLLFMFGTDAVNR